MNTVAMGLLLGVLIPAIPALIAFLLPRQKTIAFARNLRKIINIFLRQKGESLIKNKDQAGKILGSFETTIEDFTFGLYIEGRNLSDADKVKRIDDYLKETKNGL
jgi:hypothetical protein